MKRPESSAAIWGQDDGLSSLQRKAEIGVLQCLVSSASKVRRNLISDAATGVGWSTIICASADDALGAVKRSKVQFAMVDLDDRGETPQGARELVQTLIQDSSQILVGVCGHEANPEEEIWVRQLGIWLYLPGVTTSSEIATLCEHAMQIVTERGLGEELPAS
jgi:CheY-like chemotaxis protein